MSMTRSLLNLIFPHRTGNSYAIAGVMTLASLRVLAIFDAAASDPAPIRPESDVQKHVFDALRAIVRTVGLRHGPVYVELTTAASRTQPLAVGDVGAVIPPRYAAALHFRIPLVDEDLSTEELLIRNALGMDISRVYRK
jgi:hypothetical protein